jgi:hypothetical protein
MPGRSRGGIGGRGGLVCERERDLFFCISMSGTVHHNKDLAGVIKVHLGKYDVRCLSVHDADAGTAVRKVQRVLSCLVLCSLLLVLCSLLLVLSSLLHFSGPLLVVESKAGLLLV